MATSSLPGKPNPKPANQKPLNTLCIFCLSPASRSPSASRRPSSITTTTTRVVSIANPPPRPRARLFIAPTPLNLYLGLTSLVSATSSLLYLTSPSASLAKLGGTPSPSALVLVQVVASGEALVSYLCLEGLFSQIPESRRLVVRAIGVYNLFHMGAFWWGHRRYVRNPKGAGMLAMGLAVGTVTSLWYGVC